MNQTNDNEQKCCSKPQNAMTDISRAMETLKDAIGGAVQSAGTMLSSSLPPMDIRDDSTQYTISVDLPGIPKENVSLECSDSALIINATRVEEDEIKTVGYVRKERGVSQIYRRIDLPEDAKKEELEAELKDGVLKITVPKKEAYLKKVELK